MSEINFNQFETAPERVPTLEEVRGVLKELLGLENYTEVRQLTDEQGPFLYEVKTTDESTNEESLYIYTRKGEHGKISSAETIIDVAYYQDGEPVGGTSVARYVGDRWEKIS